MKPHDWAIGPRRFEGTRRLHFQVLKGPSRTYRTSWILTVKVLVHSKRRESKTKWCGVISQNYRIFQLKTRMFIQYLPTTCHQTPHYRLSIFFSLYKNKITGKAFILCFFPCTCLPRVMKGIQTDENIKFVFCLFSENRKLEERQHLFCFCQFLNP